MRLAALLPPFNGTGSFEQTNPTSAFQINCWTPTITGGTWAPTPLAGEGALNTHSSTNCFYLEVGAGASGNFAREYKNEAPFRRFADTSTHMVLVTAWANANDPRNKFQLEFAGQTSLVESLAAVALHQLSASVASDWEVRIATVDDVGLRSAFFDDINVGVDAVTLVPDWQWQTRHLQMREEQVTLAYRRWNTGFGSSRSYEIPLRYVPSSVADLLNWWHGQQFTLLLEVNSEEGDVHLVRLVNPDSPMQQLQQPYGNLYQGTLQLQLVTTRGFE